MQTMYREITGRILGIFFIFCAIGSMFMTDVFWPVTVLFMLAGFMAIPLPNNRKLLILRYVLYYSPCLGPASNWQLQAMRITPWPGLVISFVEGGIAMYMAISSMSPPLPAAKADTNHHVDYEQGVTTTSVAAEAIKSARPARALEQAQAYTILKTEDYPAPRGKGRYKVIAHSKNARTFEQRAQTAIQIAVDWHNKTQAYEILVWLEILPALSARVAIADYYPHNVTAWEKNAPYQLQVQATNYQAGVNGEYKSIDIILKPYNFNSQQAAAP